MLVDIKCYNFVIIFFLRVLIKGRVMRYVVEENLLKWKCLYKFFEIVEVEIYVNY